MREWLVIESSMKNAVFATEEQRKRKGYIPRDVAEKLLGRAIEDGRYEWFTREEGERMRAHPEWRDTQPMSREEVIDEAVRAHLACYPGAEARASALRHIAERRCAICVRTIRAKFLALARRRLPSDS